MIVCISCLCGGSDSLIRDTLKRYGYKDWLKTKIYKGKEKSLLALEKVPPTVEINALRNMLENTGKWAVIIGCNENGCRWSDISRNREVSQIEAENIIKAFA